MWNCPILGRSTWSLDVYGPCSYPFVCDASLLASREQRKTHNQYTNTKMKIEIIIPDQEIEDALITALEGGSNYWYFIPDVQVAQRHYKETSLALSQKVIRAVLEHNETIDVYDVEDENTHLGSITQANIQRGFQLWFAYTQEHDDAIIFDPGMDADAADILFQYIVMGELVYG